MSESGPVDDPENQMTEDASADNVDTPDELLTIYVVPVHSRARSLGDGRYEPCHVSIGPYHRGFSHLRREANKRKCLDDLSVIVHGRRNVEDLEGKLRTEVTELLPRAQVYYDARVDNPQELVEMLILDGCYLITHYGKVVDTLNQQQNSSGSSVGASSTAPRDSHSSSAASVQSISNEQRHQQDPALINASSEEEDTNCGPFVRDTWYLQQNQIPFFLLEMIYYQITGCAANYARRVFTHYAQRLLCSQELYISTRVAWKREPDTVHHLLHLLHTFFRPSNPPAEAEDNTGKVGPWRHLLHLLHTFFRPSNPPAEAEGNTGKVGPWRRATEYREYGNIQFKGHKIGDNKALSVLDVAIEGRKVLLPRLPVNGNTWTILLNLMALEQAYPTLGSYVTSYCVFMSQIACTAEDVELLLRDGVIESFLGGPEKVAEAFTQLCSGVVFDMNDIGRNYLKPIWHALEKLYTSRRQNIVAWVCQRYLSWRNISVFLGVISAIIILVSGVVSAIYQVLSYKHSPSASAPSPH